MSKYRTIKYSWEGLYQSGETTSGILNANSIELARAELRKRGIIARKIVKKRAWVYTQSIKSSEITVFTRQLATLFKAGIALRHAFEMIETGVKNPHMKTLIKTIRTDIGTGLMLTQALSRHPTYFNPLYCNMVHAGEQSGQLDVMLQTLAVYREKMASIKRKVNKAMAYPIAVTLIAMLVTSGLLAFVIPQFDSLFKSFDAALPPLTRYVIMLSIFLKTWWLIILSMITAVIYGGIYMHKHSSSFALTNHRLLLILPIIGNIIQKASVARFARTLSLTFSAGLPLTEALTSIAGVSGGLYAQASYKIRDDISQGQSLQHAIQNTKLFPEMAIQLISIGEESGTLELMLGKLADFYDEEVETAVDALSGLLEPVIMTILGLLIGGLVVAMYLPILKLGTII